ncbi:hypothetical protein RUM43_010696 [Polyplax serrata]|uniref:Uncharacterized protein n=1 Tax=Polyplax serrata TaxID=468196 RepID=A0AAN8PL80_POLSC
MFVSSKGQVVTKGRALGAVVGTSRKPFLGKNAVLLESEVGGETFNEIMNYLNHLEVSFEERSPVTGRGYYISVNVTFA